MGVVRASRGLVGISAACMAALLVACSGGGSATTSGAGGGGGAGPLEVRMDFTRAGGFYASPFPSDDRVSNGAVDMTGFPNLTNATLVKQSLDMVTHDVHGFGTTSGVYFTLTRSLGRPKLPDLHATVRSGSPVMLVGVDEGAADFGKRYPIDVAFVDDGGPFGAPELLSIVPYQGVPLREHTRYAAVVLTALAADDGTKVAAGASMQALAKGQRPDGLADAAFAEYRAALASLGKLGVDAGSIAGLAVFTTDAPTKELGAVVAAMNALPVPVNDAPFAPHEVFDTYCVFESTIEMPVYQGGKPPYAESGGAWVFDAKGTPVLQRKEEANFVVTVPRQAMPAGGFPVVLLSRTGAGGDRPLVDRGVQAMTGGPPITPGTGPALYYAMAGFAGASIDGPLGGLRNPTGGNEDFLIFNTSNPRALRDNIRQSAAELALQAHVLANVTFDASSCPGFSAPSGMVTFDTSSLVLMGHSMGATISPLSVAAEPAFRAEILSGAGGSWIENVLYKESPVPLLGISEVLLGVEKGDYHLSEHDPALNLFQWAEESADPPAYARAIVLEPPSGTPRHVLMEQGIVDTYILPAIANATSLSIGLDLGEKELDDTTPKLATFTPLGDVLDLVGRKTVARPVELDVTVPKGKVTALVVQHPSDGVEDGHEIVFQTDPPKREYVCFLRTLLTGTPRVPDDAGPVGKCD
ncbi:MAG TPA: hypothetical protein VHB21_12165 [Minicystis sp.]|nr:hypothetical protein [Minicystis sp.]